MTSREQFESWMRNSTIDWNMCRLESNDEYLALPTHTAWLAWQEATKLALARQVKVTAMWLEQSDGTRVPLPLSMPITFEKEEY